MGEKRPFQERTRINTPEQIEGEIQKIYRMVVNGKITPQKAKSRIDVLNALLRARADNPALVEASERPFVPGFDTLNITGIPPGWVVIGLLGDEAHVPRAILPLLRELLPPDAIGRPPSADGVLPPLPIAPELPPEITSLLDSGDQAPPPEAA